MRDMRNSFELPIVELSEEMSPERSRMYRALRHAGKDVRSLAMFLAMGASLGPDQEAVRRALPEHALDVRIHRLRRERKDHEIGPQTDETLFEGFEATDIDPARFQEYLRVILPAQWLDRAHLHEIRMNPRHVLLETPGLEHVPKAAHCTIYFNGKAPDIEIVQNEFKDLDGEYAVRELLTSLTTHEIIHGNDWRSSPDLSTEDAKKLHAWVNRLRSSSAAVHFPESGGIKHAPTHSREAVESMKDTEYFAELMAEALQTHSGYPDTVHSTGEFQQLFETYLRQIHTATPESAQEHSRLVLWYLSKAASSFDLPKSISTQESARQKVITHYRLARARRFMQFVPDPLLRDTLLSLLHSSEERARDVHHASDVSILDVIERSGLNENAKNAALQWEEIVKQLRAIREDAVWEQETAESLTALSRRLKDFVEQRGELSESDQKKLRAILLRLTR